LKKDIKRPRKKLGNDETKILLSEINADYSEAETGLLSPDGSIKGTVESIIFRNEKNGYAVINFDVSNVIISATGILPDVSEGDNLSLFGKWENNPRWGHQFRILEYRTEEISASADIERYLASGTIKGIGPKTAKRIVEAFGEDTADVIENHPEWLAQIQGINIKRAHEISEEFRSKSDIRSVMTFFREYFGPALTMKIYNQFGKDSVETAKSNPYRLSDEIDGISFEAADQMGEKLGIERSSPQRIAAGIRHALSETTFREGHTCCPYNYLVTESARVLGCDTDTIIDVLKHLILTRSVVIERKEDGTAFVYDRESFEDEKLIADKLISLCHGGAALDFSDIEGCIRMSESENGLRYDDDQRQAIVSALSRGVLVLTGGPGTGKTTVITALIGIFNSLNMKVALAAPTGRAAKRMTEATTYEAKTVHRLLEVEFDGTTRSGKSKEKHTFNRNEKNYLDEEAIIVDEVSMMDNALTAALLRAIRPGSRLVIIGDSDQLPSVGPGNVLADIVASKTLPVVTLNHVFRQAETSLIVTNAHAINKGEMPILDAKDKDFFYMQRENDTEIANTVADLVARRLPAAYGDNAVQVIVPSRKGMAGTESLNVVLREMMNPAEPGKTEWKRGETVFRQGDRVMQIKNNYQLEWSFGSKTAQGVFNGDMGVIKRIDIPGEIMEIDFDGRHVDYSFSDLADLEPAYAVTVHKSQGSEYGTVVIPLGNIPPMLRTRNLLYTAVTRAKKRVVVVGMMQTLADMVSNARPTQRYTGLSRKLVNRKNGTNV